MIVEEARETDTGIVLEDWELEQLNQKLTLIADVLEDGNKPRLTFTVCLWIKQNKSVEYHPLTVLHHMRKLDLLAQIRRRRPYTPFEIRSKAA